MKRDTLQTVLNEAIKELEKNYDLKADRVLDIFIELAVEYEQVEVMCSSEQMEIIVGKNDRFYFSFEDCLGRFRHILPRLFLRCSDSFPVKFEGTFYGFESDVMLAYGNSAQEAMLHIETKNISGYPWLLLRTIPV